MKNVRSPNQYTSPPTHTIEDDLNRRDRISISSTDQEDFEDSPTITWSEDKDESAFIGFLGELGSIEFELPLFLSYLSIAYFSRGVNESSEVVRHCLTLFFTHVNSQQYYLSAIF